jgi:AraC-like DNA-binding protein
MTTDALSDVLRTVRLTGAAFFDVEASAPWVAEQPPREMVLPKILPGAEQLIAYHVVTEGSCFAGIIGAPPVEVAAGEVVVFTRGDPHALSSRPGMRATADTVDMLEAAASQRPFMTSYGGNGPVTARLVCGFLACDAQPFNPLFDALPPVIRAGDRNGADGGWIGQFIRMAAAESAARRAGSESILARLSELMFIEVVRRHIETLPAEQAGWLSGLRDPCIGRALSLLHARPAEDWTIEGLAREVAVSRSVLAERFTAMVGMPPIQYLARWRMQVAAGLLSCGTRTMASVAAEVGYGSEAAFSRAFKKLAGVSPSAWKQRARPAPPAG